jgi:hypothetical protein
MASPEVGLKVIFYLYPCLLFVTLLGSQCLQFYLSRGREPRRIALDNEQKQKAESIRRVYARVIWFLQLVLSLLFVASIAITAREAVSGHHDSDGTVDFSFSAYLVRSSSLATNAIVLTKIECRHLMQVYCFTSSQGCCQIRKGRGLRAVRIAMHGSPVPFWRLSLLASFTPRSRCCDLLLPFLTFSSF